MNINIATWGRLVRRAIPTVSTNSFSPQGAETGHSSLPGSPTPCRYGTPTPDRQITPTVRTRLGSHVSFISCSDPLVTKLDFDKEPTPGPKHYPASEVAVEPPALLNLPDNKDEVRVWFCRVLSAKAEPLSSYGSFVTCFSSRPSERSVLV